MPLSTCHRVSFDVCLNGSRARFQDKLLGVSVRDVIVRYFKLAKPTKKMHSQLRVLGLNNLAKIAN